MAMTKILCPNKQYTGVSASVPFVNGVGETDKPYLIDWFKKNGYTVEDDGESKRKSRKKAPDDKKPADEQPENNDDLGGDDSDDEQPDGEAETQE